MAYLSRPSPGSITNAFGIRSSDYILGYHPGTDFGWGNGSTVYAVATAPIVYAGADPAALAAWGLNPGYGNVIIQDISGILGPGWIAIYAHLSKFLIDQGVPRAGQALGIQGDTGFVTATHLHFELRANNVPKDPMLYLGLSVASVGDVTPFPTASNGDIDMRLMRHPNGTFTTVGETTFQHHTDMATVNADAALFGAAVEMSDPDYRAAVANTRVRKAYLLAGISGGGVASVDVEAVAARTEVLLADDFARLAASNAALAAAINANIDDQPTRFNITPA